MKILVTGGVGFIGSYAVEMLLEQGHEVVVVDSLITYIFPPQTDTQNNILKRVERLSEKCQIIRGSTQDLGFLSKVYRDFNPDRVLHLAAMPLANLAIYRPEEAMSSIINGTTNLLQCARDHKGLERFVYVSSSMVYGDFIEDPIPETAPCNPKEVYGGLKLCGEVITRSFSKLYDVDYAIVRPSAVYGPTDNNKRVLAIFLNNALDGKPLKVKGADTKLDFTYVTDTAEGVCRVLLEPKASKETFNITRGRCQTIGEAAEIIKGLIPSTEVIYEDFDKRMPTRGALDISKARGLIGYDPKVDFEDGLKTYLQFLKDQKGQ